MADMHPRDLSVPMDGVCQPVQAVTYRAIARG